MNNQKLNEKCIEQIHTLLLVLQSVNAKWTSPEIMKNVLKNQIENINTNIDEQISEITDVMFEFLTNIGALEKGIIDDKTMQEHYNTPGYKLCTDFSLFQLKYENGQIIKNDLEQYNTSDLDDETESW